ncbi:NUDIX hydrolase [Cupriavidus metallidurans]|uniref:NUDIX hydrolase n=1 Tax=Cupriavidus metallidurans TaxID=119219 RepID=UPI001CCF266E|nr:NUDIX hydrolase [Cupriavidus metallidurans]UBM07910.1 NUDIX domain-containing protein [Cupriavidus metallidurans]
MKTKVRATVVCARGDRVLLVSKDGCRWALPGGRPNKNETFADAAGRELQEETSVIARGFGFLFQVIGATTVHHVFVANIGKSAVPKPSKEIDRCQWFTQSELREIVVSPTTFHIIESFWAARHGVPKVR